MKVNFGNFELFSVKIHFAYEGKNIWVSVGDMSNLIAGGNDMGVSASYLVAEGQKRYPELTAKQAVRLPYITASGKPSEKRYWYYRTDLDLAVFGLHPDKIALIETELHQPLREGLKDVLVGAEK